MLPRSARFLATPTAGHYVGSKHAVLGLTKTAAVEYGRYGIRVNAVSPGAVRTQMLLGVRGSEEALDRMRAVYPLAASGDQRKLPTLLHGSFLTSRHISPASR